MALVTTICLGLASVTAVAGAQGGDALEATEKGVTEDTIKISVVAAIDVPGFPGLFQGNHNGVDAWAEWINGRGGLAGRQVEVEHFDPKLSGDEARAAFRTACEESFAIIGTGVLLLQNFDDIINCTDKAGAVTGLPDFGVTVTEPNEQCAPSNFAVNPAALQCATKDDNPQTYIANAGPSKYLTDKNGKQKGGFLFPSDSASAKNGQVPVFAAMAENGVATTFQNDLSALAPQSAYTSVVGGMRDAGVTWAQSGLAFDSTVKLRKEAATQGFDADIWMCSLQCYDSKLLAPENVDAVQDQYVYIPFLPFLGKGSEAKQNKALRTFLKFTDEPDGFAIQAFAAGMFLEEAVKKATAGDDNNLTRAGVLEAAASIHEFDAGGMIAPTDVGGRVPNDCFVLMQVKGDQLKRIFPKKKGTLECDPDLKVTSKLDLTN